MSSKSAVNINKALGIWALILIIFGTIGNILCIFVCLRQRLRKTPTFIFFSFLAICDTISLYGWNLDHFIEAFYGKVIEDTSIAWCKTVLFYNCFSLQSSSWFLLTMSFEVYISVRVKLWRKIYFNIKKTFIASILILIIFAALNVHIFMTLHYKIMANESSKGMCYNNTLFLEWRKVHTYLYSIVPFFLLALTNILLLRHALMTTSINQTIKSKMNRRSMTITIFLITLFFLVFSSPNAIIGFFLTDLFALGLYGQNIVYFCNCLGYTYHSCNFLVFLCLNKQFLREVCDMFHSITFNNLNKINRYRASNIYNIEKRTKDFIRSNNWPINSTV